MTSIMENQVQTVMKTGLAGSKIQCRSLDTHIKVFGYTLLEISTDQFIWEWHRWQLFSNLYSPQMLWGILYGLYGKYMGFCKG